MTHTPHYFPSSFVADPADATGLTHLTIRRTIRRRIEARWTGDYGTIDVRSLMGDDNDGTRPVADAVAFTVNGMNVRHTPPDANERRQVSKARRLDLTTGEGDRRTGDLTVWLDEHTATTIRQHLERKVIREAYTVRSDGLATARKARHRNAKNDARKARRAALEAEHRAKLAAARDEHRATVAFDVEHRVAYGS
jgi:hypothetical protein